MYCTSFQHVAPESRSSWELVCRIPKRSLSPSSIPLLLLSGAVRCIVKPAAPVDQSSQAPLLCGDHTHSPSPFACFFPDQARTRDGAHRDIDPSVACSFFTQASSVRRDLSGPAALGATIRRHRESRPGIVVWNNRPLGRPRQRSLITHCMRGSNPNNAFVCLEPRPCNLNLKPASVFVERPCLLNTPAGKAGLDSTAPSSPLAQTNKQTMRMPTT